MKQNARIIIADDHPVFRRGLRMVIESSEANLKVVAEADDGEQALSAIENHKPDLIVLDVNMPQMNGFDVVRRLQAARSKVAIVFLTMHKDEEMFNAAMDLGVSGYILKDSAVTDIIACLKAVLNNQPYISPQLSSFLLNRSRRAVELTKKIPTLESLTPTERRILKLIADYKTSKEIADILCIHSRTVDNHRTNISQKLDLKGSHSLLKFAVENKSQI
jgi:DNA-binding NarL/FixJ family response regulator